MAPASMSSTQDVSLPPSSVFTRKVSFRGPASASPPSDASWNVMVDACGPKERPIEGPRCILRYRRSKEGVCSGSRRRERRELGRELRLSLEVPPKKPKQRD